MRYAVARYNQNQRDKAYRIYISDILRIIAQPNVKDDLPRFIDMIDAKADNRTGDEIVADVIKKSGLEVVA